jgi:hypothetical protein
MEKRTGTGIDNLSCIIVPPEVYGPSTVLEATVKQIYSTTTTSTHHSKDIEGT